MFKSIDNIIQTEVVQGNNTASVNDEGQLAVGVFEGQNQMTVDAQGQIYLGNSELQGILEAMQRQAINGYKFGLSNPMKLDKHLTFFYDQSVFIPIPVGGGAVTVDHMILNLDVDDQVGALAQMLTVDNFYKGPSKITDIRFSGTLDNSALCTSMLGINSVHNGIQIANFADGQDYIVESYGGRSHVMYFTLTTPASGPETATVTLNGLAYNVDLTDATLDPNFNLYELRLGLYGNWLAEQYKNQVTFIYAVDGDQSGTYSFTSTGTATGTFVTRTTGIAKTTNVIPKSLWLSNQSLDSAVFNEYVIRYYYNGCLDYQVFVYSDNANSLELIYEGHLPPPILPQMPVEGLLLNNGSGTSHHMELYTVSSWYEDDNVFNYALKSRTIEKFTVPDPNTNATPVSQVGRTRFETNGYRNYSVPIGIDVLMLGTGNGNRPFIFQFGVPATLGLNTIDDYPDYSQGDIDPTNSIVFTDTQKLHTGTLDDAQTKFTILSDRGEKITYNFQPGSVSLPPGAEFAILTQSDASGEAEGVFNYFQLL
jgi:hypothetical protein